MRVVSRPAYQFWENAISWTIFYKAALPKGFDIILAPLMDHFWGDPILYIFWGILPYLLHVQYFYPALFQSCPVKRIHADRRDETF